MRSVKYFIHTLKRKSQLALERSMIVGLRLDQSECACAVDVQDRRRWIRMVHHIKTIDAKLKRLGFGNLKTLAQVCIQAPRSRTFDGLPADRAPVSGKGIFQEDLLWSLSVSDSTERAEWLQRIRHCGALRVGNIDEGSTSEVVPDKLIVGARVAPPN